MNAQPAHVPVSISCYRSQVKWFHEDKVIRYPQGREYYISNPGSMDERNKTSVLTILKATDSMSGSGKSDTSGLVLQLNPGKTNSSVRDLPRMKAKLKLSF